MVTGNTDIALYFDTSRVWNLVPGKVSIPLGQYDMEGAAF